MYVRSPELMLPAESALLVVDVQEKLLPVVENPQRVLFNAMRLAEGAKLLEVATLATEQYPQGLGKTVSQLLSFVEQSAEKRAFSGGVCTELFQALADKGISRIVICGMETHVCVLQTALDLLAESFAVQIVVDAVSSRYKLDYETALRRLESSGCTLTTTETVLFEWCETSEHEQFKAISQLVRRLPE